MKNLELRGDYREVGYDIVLDGKTIGYFSTVLDTNEDIYIENFEVDADYRNKGIGTAALKLFAEIADEDWKTLYLAPDGEDNQRLYERVGEEWTANAPEIDQGFGVYIINA